MHFFNEKVAEELGVNAAIIFQNIGYWEEHNRNNNMHLHDGKYWTYNSNAAFQKQFSYLGKKAIQTAIEKLKESGYILIGNYNDNTWDHTSWYTLTEKGQSIYQNETIDGAKRDNRQTEKEQSYNNNYKEEKNTNRNTDENTNNNERYVNESSTNRQKTSVRNVIPPSVDDVEAYCKERGNGIDANNFCDFYTARGWKIGNTKMKDWQAAVRTWEKRDGFIPVKEPVGDIAVNGGWE